MLISAGRMTGTLTATVPQADARTRVAALAARREWRRDRMAVLLSAG
jgi:hypothetical protein